ncbi:hypothetical protein [Actinopolymorpha pittospori]|jgi:hypothetical protein|uniref:Membrane-bound ClpP family serine protease n=1 Tax=Actinopolymorpha pittospori TaxID=648752 RepID=A0A927N1D6_9ACTN|nr:hypothetical protein [Actinopolymorpha pittospori]MBE1610496.1 membrane-bound ClpP family serine protease [Actinopolymorpha pittospori]
MISTGAGQVAFRWAVTIVIFAGLLLLMVDPGTPQFVITLFMMVVGALFAAAVFVLVRIKKR